MSPFQNYMDVYNLRSLYDNNLRYASGHFRSGGDTSFCADFEKCMLAQNLRRNHQAVIFFAAASARQREFLFVLDCLPERLKDNSTTKAVTTLVSPSTRDNWAYRSICDAISATRDIQFQNIRGRVMMLRCYSKTRDLAKATILYEVLKTCNSDANFALNYPAGYCLDANGRSVISKNITLALYAWNYRLRRERKRPFSKADLWFVGLRIVENLHTKTPWHRAVELVGHIPYGAAPNFTQASEQRLSSLPRDLVWSQDGALPYSRYKIATREVCELSEEDTRPRLRSPIHRCNDPLARFEVAISYPLSGSLLGEYDR